MKKPNPKLLLGAHLSGAGGLENALFAGQQIGCTTGQLFTHSNRQWHMNPLTPEDIERFAAAKKSTGIEVVVVHASYLINMASAKPQNRAISLKTTIKELERCEQLGIQYLVLHPGSYVEGTESAGIEHLIDGLNSALDQTPGSTSILLETMAGQGSVIGHQLEQLAFIRSKIIQKERVGICVDTCHLFAAGYNFTSEQAYAAFWRDFDSIIGLQHLRAIHMNDSKTICGSRVDRHAHIGQGTLGLEAFRLLMNDPRFFAIPKILETPKDDDTHRDDIRNLATLKGLLSAETKELLGI